MPAELDARKAARDTLTAALTPLPIIYAGADAPAAAAEYGVLTVISASVAGDMGGYSWSSVRLQLDLWSLSVNDSAVGVLGARAALALNAAGWNLQEGRLWPPEGQKDAAGKRWQRYMLSAIREYGH